MRLAGLGIALVAVLGGAFVAGRSTDRTPRARNPLALEHGIAIGVTLTRAGALAAADNYAAAGATASLSTAQLVRFADAVIDPANRAVFISETEQLAQSDPPPAGAHVTAATVAHRLEGYGHGLAQVDVWELASQWDGGVPPTQSWALIDLSLRWRGDRWRVTSIRESLLGPVPALVAGGGDARSSSAWDQGLAGMTAPYYGDS